MNEDWRLNPEFEVESAEDFLNRNIHDEHDRYILKSFMQPCRNCGEFVTKKYLNKKGICHLCSKTELHEEKRAIHSNASSNFGAIDNIIDKWCEFTEES